LSVRREQRKKEPSSSSSSSSPSEKEESISKDKPKLVVTFDFDAAPAVTQSAEEMMCSPTQFKQDEVLHHISTSEQKDSTVKNPNINIVQRKQ
jgi:hypothetical protein